MPMVKQLTFPQWMDAIYANAVIGTEDCIYPVNEHQWLHAIVSYEGDAWHAIGTFENGSTRKVVTLEQIPQSNEIRKVPKPA